MSDRVTWGTGGGGVRPRHLGYRGGGVRPRHLGYRRGGGGPRHLGYRRGGGQTVFPEELSRGSNSDHEGADGVPRYVREGEKAQHGHN